MNIDDTISKFNSLKTIPDELFKRTSDSTRWVIPLECIHDPKKVWLTIEEAKTIEHCFAIFQKHFKLFEPELKIWQELRKRIEQVEGKE